MDGGGFPRSIRFSQAAGSAECAGSGVAGGDALGRAAVVSARSAAFLWRGRSDRRRHGLDVAGIFLDGEAGALSPAGVDEPLANGMAEFPQETCAITRSFPRGGDRFHAAHCISLRLGHADFDFRRDRPHSLGLCVAVRGLALGRAVSGGSAIVALGDTGKCNGRGRFCGHGERVFRSSGWPFSIPPEQSTVFARLRSRIWRRSRLFLGWK